MKIILVALHPDTTKQDIIHFLSPVIKGSFFRKKGVIESLEIKVLYDNKAKTTEYHGLVIVKPALVANRIIKKLHRKALKGKYIAVREYHDRTWHNDPRLNGPSVIAYPDRRVGDRRRFHLQVVQKEEVGFTGYENFSRTHQY